MRTSKGYWISIENCIKKRETRKSKGSILFGKYKREPRGDCLGALSVWFGCVGFGEAWNEVPSFKERTVDVQTKQLEFFKNGLSVKNFRIKVEISTTNTCSRPFISKLGVIFNESL